MNSTKENKVTKWLISLSAKTKLGFIIFAIISATLILYDILVYKSNILEYFKALIICILVWFGVKFVFWFQIKNPYYNEIFFNVASLFILIITIIVSVMNIVSFIMYGFNSGAFIFSVIPLSVISVQSLRKEKKAEMQ